MCEQQGTNKSCFEYVDSKMPKVKLDCTVNGEKYVQWLTLP